MAYLAFLVFPGILIASGIIIGIAALIVEVRTDG